MPNKNEFYVYLWTNLINGKQYVGITNDVVARMYNHVCGNESLLSRAINKYGGKNFDFTILHTCSTREKANYLERKEIFAHNCRLPYGYNLAVGGYSVDGVLDAIRENDPLKYKELNDRRKEGQRRAHAARTSEERSVIALKGKEFYGKEQRQEANKRGNIKYTPERRKVAAQKALLTWTPEKRQGAIKKSNSSYAPGERSANLKRSYATSTLEQRRERLKRAREVFGGEVQSKYMFERNAKLTSEQRRQNMVNAHIALAAKRMLKKHIKYQPWPSDKLKYKRLLESHIEGNIWLAYDPNSGHHATRLHPRSIVGYTIANPHSG